MSKGRIIILALLALIRAAAAFGGGFPEELRHASQFRWLPDEEARSIRTLPDGRIKSRNLRAPGAAVDADTRIRIPLEFGKRIRIEAEKDRLNELVFRYVFDTETGHAAMDCPDLVPSGCAWTLLSHLDEGCLEVTAETRVPIRLYRGSGRMRLGFWDELAGQMMRWAAGGDFEATAERFLSEIPVDHPAVPVIRFILVRIPPAWKQTPPERSLYRKYIKTLIAFRVSRERLLQEKRVSLVRAADAEDRSEHRAFDGVFPYSLGNRFRYENLRPGIYLLDTRIGYSAATLSDLRRYRTDVYIDGRPAGADLFETTLYRGRRGNGKDRSLAGLRRRSIVTIGPSQREITIVATSPVWCRLSKAASQPRFCQWAAGLTSPARRGKDPATGPDLLFASAVLHNLEGNADQARQILSSLILPLDTVTEDSGLYEQIAVRIEWCRATAPFQPDRALEMLLGLDDHLASSSRLDDFSRNLLGVEVADLASQLLEREGAYGKAAAILDPLQAAGRADRQLQQRLLQSTIHSSLENPGRRMLPGLFQTTLSGPMDDRDIARLRGLRSGFLTWTQIHQSLKSKVRGKTFFDRIESTDSFAPVLDPSVLYYPYAFAESVRPDLRRAFPESSLSPYLVKGALLSASEDESIVLQADQQSIPLIEREGEPREFELELPPGAVSIRPLSSLSNSDAGHDSVLLLTLPPVSDRLRKPLSRKLDRYVKRSYELLPDEGLDYAFSTTGVRTGLRILIRSDSAIPESVQATIDGRSREIRLSSSKGDVLQAYPYQMQWTLSEGDHRLFLSRSAPAGSSTLFVQVSVEEPRTGLFEVDGCLP